MATRAPKVRRSTKLDAQTRKILRALRDARKEAVKTARLHGVPIIYEKDGKIVREKP